MNGAYKLPWWDIQVAANYNSRSGYPLVRSVQTPARPNGAGAAVVYLDKRGDLRLPAFSQLDLRVDKTVVLGRVRAVLSMDVFNLLNENMALSVRSGQNASNANQISSILAPRVLRFGARITFYGSEWSRRRDDCATGIETGPGTRPPVPGPTRNASVSGNVGGWRWERTCANHSRRRPSWRC